MHRLNTYNPIFAVFNLRIFCGQFLRVLYRCGFFHCGALFCSGLVSRSLFRSNFLYLFCCGRGRNGILVLGTGEVSSEYGPCEHEQDYEQQQIEPPLALLRLV